MAWRQEAVRKVIRKRRQGISVTFAQIAAEMNEDPGRGRRPRLSAEGLRRAYKKYSEEILEESEFDSSDDEDDDSDQLCKIRQFSFNVLFFGSGE